MDETVRRCSRRNNQTIKGIHLSHRFQYRLLFSYLEPRKVKAIKQWFPNSFARGAKSSQPDVPSLAM